MTRAADRTPPLIDFTATGWRSLLEAAERFAQEKFGSGDEVAWTDFNPSNVGIVLFDVLAQTGDMLMFHLNAFAREQLVTTLVRELSFRNISKSYAFELDDAVQATGDIEIVSEVGDLPFTLLNTFKISNGADVIYQPQVDTLITVTPQTAPFIEGDLIETEVLAISDGSQFQRYELASSPVLTITLLVTVDGILWTSEKNFSDLQPDDEEYVLNRLEGGGVEILFGDGINGRVPPNGLEILATYKVGGGDRGNVGPNELTSKVTPLTSIISVTNPAETSGGVSAQTVSQGKRALPGTIATLDRAIADGDFAIEAVKVTGVAKAIEIEGDPAQNEVLLVIAPEGGGNPSSILKNQVIAAARNFKAVTFRVVPLDPFFENDTIEMDLFVKDNARQADVLTKVTDKLLSLFAFDNVTFGQSFTRQQINAELDSRNQGFEGVDFIDLKVMLPASVIRVELGQTNTGNGTFDQVTVDREKSTRRERRITITQTSPIRRFQVIEKILGVSSALTDSVLSDETALFEPGELVGLSLNPNLKQTIGFAITANTETTITVASGLQAVAIPGDNYSIDRTESVLGKALRATVDLESPADQKRVFIDSTTNYEVGDLVLARPPTGLSTISTIASIQTGVSVTLADNVVETLPVSSTLDFFWRSDDSAISFALVEGSVAFVNGDDWFVDTFEKLADLEPRRTDIPQLLESNLSIRPIGGLIT